MASSIKSYYRQNEALEEAGSSSKFTFSHEVGYGGERKFVTSSLDDFWRWYQSKSEKNRKFYEVIPSQSPSKLYFDLEYPVMENEFKDADGRKMLDVLLEETKIMLYEMFGHQVLNEDIMILDATTPLKYSLHVIFTKTVFENNSSMGCFVKVLKSKLHETHSGLFDVKNKGRTVSFIDSCVYKKNQNFRCYLSRKMGKENYLLLSNIENASWKYASKEDIFKASIITNVDMGAAALKMKEDLPVQGPSTFVSTSPVTRKYKYKSPYHEIEEILLKKIYPGYIRECIYFRGLSEIVIFPVGGTRWCSNVGREHSHNNIFYICNLGDLTLVQACHRCHGYRGEKLKVDLQALDWIDNDM